MSPEAPRDQAREKMKSLGSGDSEIRPGRERMIDVTRNGANFVSDYAQFTRLSGFQDTLEAALQLSQPRKKTLASG